MFTVDCGIFWTAKLVLGFATVRTSWYIATQSSYNGERLYIVAAIPPQTFLFYICFISVINVEFLQFAICPCTLSRHMALIWHWGLLLQLLSWLILLMHNSSFVTNASLTCDASAQTSCHVHERFQRLTSGDFFHRIRTQHIPASILVLQLAYTNLHSSSIASPAHRRIGAR